MSAVKGIARGLAKTADAGWSPAIRQAIAYEILAATVELQARECGIVEARIPPMGETTT